MEYDQRPEAGGRGPATGGLPDKLQFVPELPGVYEMRDGRGVVIYVGKAKSLKGRLRSYFVVNPSGNGKVQAMMAKVHDFEYIITDTEREALVLESNLIKELRPHYNIRIKDDKHYPYLRLSVNEDFPRLTVVRRVEKDGARYFGPYPHSGAVRSLLKGIKRLFPLRTCNRAVVYGVAVGRPCLLFHLKQCVAPCTGKVTGDDYGSHVDQLELFLSGKHTTLLSDLKRLMRESSEAMDFERAAHLRDQIRDIEAVAEKQKFDAAELVDRDVVGVAQSLDEACIALFHMRDGKVVGRETVFMAGTAEQKKGDVVAAFLAQFYQHGASIPHEIVLDVAPEAADDLSAVLTRRRGRVVRLGVPKRGAKKALCQLASRNAQQALEDSWREKNGKQELLRRALVELAHHLDLASPPERLECFDISHLQGTAQVGGMVVFHGGLPAKREYRRFKVKWIEGSDDFAAMHEVLTRRFAAHRDGHERFALLPDLVIIDGGKGQLSAALDALRQEGYAHLPVVSLAKREELLYLPHRQDPVALPRDSQALYLVQRLRDETHRFALSYHREMRAKVGTSSRLERISGIGPARRRALLRHFGGIEGIEKATIEELAQVTGMNRTVAKNLANALSAMPKNNTESV